MAAIIDRLQKLIAHERSCRQIGNTAEAEAFASRIQTMLSTHKLTMSEVEYIAQETENPIGSTRYATSSGRPDQGILWLARGVALSCYCEFLLHSQKSEKTVFVFVGRNDDRILAVEMFDYLSSIGEHFAEWKAVDISKHPELSETLRTLITEGVSRKEVNQTLAKVMRKWKKDFLFGYGAAIHKRLSENRASSEKTASGSATGLILRDAQAITNYIRDRFEVKDRRARPYDPMIESAINAGYATGSEVHLKQQAALPPG